MNRATSLEEVYSAKMVKQPCGRWQAFCTCEAYSTNKYVRPTSAANMVSRHLRYHVDRMKNAWPAIVSLVGLRRVEGQTRIQILASTVRLKGPNPHRKVPFLPVIRIDLTPEQARELADQLNDYADEMEEE